MYPRNAVSPERIAVGQVVLIADGTIQSSGVAITVRGQGGAEAGSAGTIAYGADNTVYYTPTQAETNFTSFVVIASKASCFSASQTVVTTASATSGKVVLSGETHTSAVIPTVTTLTGHTAQTADHTAAIADIPTVAEFNARTLVSADYTIVSDLGVVQTGDTYALANGVTGFAAIDTVVDTINTQVGTAGAGLTNLGASGNNWNVGKTGYSLTATTGLGNQTANITGNLSGSVGSVTGTVGSVTGLTAANLDVAVSSRATPAEILTTALTESYAADGSAPTVTQALMLIQQMLGDFTISGTTMTVKGVDGVTAKATFTLNDGTSPTGLTRAT